MNDAKTFTLDLEVRFRDLDAMGHVNNAVFFTYFEEGRKSFSQQVFNYSDPSDFRFIMAHIRCDFQIPITLSNKIALQMWVTHIGSKSFNFGYKLVERSEGSIIFATGESVQVCYDYQMGKSITISDEMRAQLSEYLQT